MTAGRRVVVTGMGALTPIGNDVDASVQGLLEGRSGARYMHEWDFLADLQCRVGATVDGVDFQKLYDRRVRRTMGRVAMLAYHATKEALGQSGLPDEVVRSERTGLAYGSTSGSSSTLELFSRPLIFERSMRGLDPNAYPKIMAHTCAANLASQLRITGRVQPTASACTSSSQAVGYGYEAIKHGIAEVMICGGAEEMHYTTAVTFDLLMASSVHFNDRPKETPRPFDAGRDGLIVGEGAATMILEDYEHAKRRDAPIFAEVLGYASNCDGAHVTQPNPDGMARVMQLALLDAGLSADRVDHVHAHATATPVGDVAEATATQKVFGSRVAVSSTKGHVGHTLGACGSLEAIWSIRMMRDGFVAPTLNLTELDPQCPELDYVTELRDARPSITVSNNFAFGGVNTSIVLGPTP